MSRTVRVVALAALAALTLAPATQARKAASPVKLSRGATTLALNAGAASALQSLGIAVAPLKPAQAGAGGVAFPITNGKLDAGTYAGRIGHTGGLRLSRGGTRVNLRNFTIRVDGSPDLTAQVNGTPVSILDLDLSGAQITRSGRTLRIAGVKATLTAAAAGALNAAFGTDAFTKGLELGTATVAGRIAKR